jgi:prepilin-type N-terminal cleavage/methylation domain-containing protein
MQHLMQRAAPSRRVRRARGGRRAFTLLEILLVIALIGLLSGVLIQGAAGLLNPGPETPVQAFWKMTGTARRYALQHECQVRMTVNNTTGELEAHAADGTDLDAIKLPAGSSIRLLPGLTTTNASSTSASAFTVDQNTPLAGVTFYEDGTCNLFRAEITLDGGSTPYVIEVDPWTCATMLKNSTTNGGNR